MKSTWSNKCSAVNINSVCCSIRIFQYPFSSLIPVFLQADGLKEGDYIVTVGNTDCKWLGVTEVMRLLKDVDEEGIDIQVISVMDSNPPMVCHALLSSERKVISVV